MPSSPRRDWRRGGGALALLAALSACARVAPHPPPALAAGDPLAVVQRHAAAVRTLRAQFNATARFPGGERESSGVLLLRPPDDARLRLVAPFGLTVFDGLRTGGRTYVNSPFAGGRDQSAALFMRIGPADSILFGGAALAACRAATAPRPDTAGYWCGEPATRWLVIDGRTGTLLSETELHGGAPNVIRSYDDYRVVDGVPLPYRIRVDYPPQNVRVDIVVSRYELNPPLRDDQFAPPVEGRAPARPPDAVSDRAAPDSLASGALRAPRGSRPGQGS